MALTEKPYLREISLKREKIADFESYPFCIPSVRTLDRLEFHADATFITGENACGKSTLLEAIAVAMGFNPEGGTKNFNFSTRASHSELYRFLRLVKSIRRPRDGFFLRAESFFNVGTEIERMDAEPSFGPPIIDSYGGISLHEQSHGESFWALLSHRFRGHGLYILDEPEAALSPRRQLDVIRLMHGLIKRNSQFIIATHSPILMAYPHATIYVLDTSGFKEARYEETDHYQVIAEFLNHRDRFFNDLLSDE
jgi:predicted ATPase